MGREEWRRWSSYAFVGAFAGATLLFGWVVLPFLTPVLLGAFLVLLFQPLQTRVSGWLPRHPGLAASICTAVVLLSTLGPIVASAVILSRELLSLGSYASQMLEPASVQHELMGRLPAWLSGYLADPAGLKLERELFGLLASGANLLASLLIEGSALVADAALMGISTYYFFLDGRRIHRAVRRLIPIERRYLDAFSAELKDTSYALFYGNAVTGVLQGLTGWLGFWIAGIPRPHVWALAMVVVSFLPVGGTAIIWLPVGAYLLLTHQAGAGLFILGWGAVMVGLVDNLARPKLCGARMALHPLLVFVTMFGGFAVFGMMGVLAGPLVASIFMAMVRIYRRDFLPEHAHVWLGGEREPTCQPAPAKGEAGRGPPKEQGAPLGGLHESPSTH